MPQNMKSTRVNVIPTMRYKDAGAAVKWLCDAFGFERHMVIEGEGGRIAHAQLRYGNGMIMLGSTGAGDYSALVRPPDGPEAVNTQSAYIVVVNPDAHYQRSVAAGAVIVLDIKDEDYGGRGYSCRDPEGHIWNFGNYDPWQEH